MAKNADDLPEPGATFNHLTVEDAERAIRNVPDAEIDNVVADLNLAAKTAKNNRELLEMALAAVSQLGPILVRVL